MVERNDQPALEVIRQGRFEDAEDHNSIANLFRECGRPADAIFRYRRAIELKPDDATAHANLAAILSEQRQFPEALAEFQTALSLCQNHLGAQIGLGLLQAELGRRDEALAAAEHALRIGSLGGPDHYFAGLIFAKCELKHRARGHLQLYLQFDPQDRRGAAMLLAAFDEVLPERAPRSFIEGLYTKRAASWDETIKKTSKILRGDILVTSAFEQLASHQSNFSGKLNILDAGCGTGLVGARIRPRASRLAGVDLSEAMLFQAKEKGIYDQLDCADLVTYMVSDQQSYDVITCASTLIHFGDLHPVFDAASKRLSGGGLFVFTIFPNADSDSAATHPVPELARGGCFAHGQNYVASVAKESGFYVETLKNGIFKNDPGQASHEIVVAIRRLP